MSAVKGEGEGAMETYRYYPPQMRSTAMPYEVVTAGATGCRHELLDADWRDRITIQDGRFASRWRRCCRLQVGKEGMDRTRPIGASRQDVAPSLLNIVVPTECDIYAITI